MNQMNEKGGWGPTKVFPCDCGSEGVMVTIDVDDEFLTGGPFIGLAFWEMKKKLEKNDALGCWERIKLAWRILRGGSLWTDMVYMSAPNARNLANHILYLLAKAKRKEQKEITKDVPLVPL